MSKIACKLFRNVFAQPLGVKVTPDYHLRQTLYLLHWRRRSLMILVQHTLTLHQWLTEAYDAANYALAEHYWEFGNRALSPYRTARERRWAERQVFWGRFASDLYASAHNAFVCRVWGHAYTNQGHDPEHGTEDIMCDRCGHFIHAQF